MRDANAEFKLDLILALNRAPVSVQYLGSGDADNVMVFAFKTH